MNIPVLVKWLTTIAKVLGVISAFDLTPLSPKSGFMLVIVASTLKDACNVLAARFSAVNPQVIASVSTVLLLLTFGLAGVGCASKTNNGNITSVTSSCIGLDLSQDAASPVPHVRIGFIRTQFHVVPTGSNVFAPAVISSIALDSSWNSNAIEEDFATGGATRDLAGGNSPAKVAAAHRLHGKSTNAPAPATLLPSVIPDPLK